VPLTPDEIAANLDQLIGLHDELGAVIEAVRKARADGTVSERERRVIRRKSTRLAKELGPLVLMLALDVID